MKQELDTSMRNLTVCRVTELDPETRKQKAGTEPSTFAGKLMAVEVWDTVAEIYRVMGMPDGVEERSRDLAGRASQGDLDPLPPMRPAVARQIVDLYLELRKYGSALVRYRTPLVMQAYNLVAASVHPHTAWETELLRDDEHTVLCQCPYSTLDRAWIAHCYRKPVASYDDLSQAMEGHSRHVRECPEGAMPWAQDIKWTGPEPSFVASAMGEWLNHRITRNETKETAND